MAMKKLEELCDAKNIAVKDLEEDMYQLVSGASTFIEISEDNLKAEMPPHATLLTLLGQDKRPLRAWDKCTPYERVSFSPFPPSLALTHSLSSSSAAVVVVVVVVVVGIGAPTRRNDHNHP
jgi:hypothetical protein